MSTIKSGFFRTGLSMIMILCLVQCFPSKVIRREYHLGDKLKLHAGKPFYFKVHMKDGGLFFISPSNQSTATDTLEGYGQLYGPDRHIREERVKTKDGHVRIYRASDNFRDTVLLSESSQFRIPVSAIALIETNESKGISDRILGLSLVGVPLAIISIYCMINPKSCFGSCPTFYASEGNDTTLMAEGFSSSILKSWEKPDIDMLYWTHASGREFHLRLTNEALETHMIRSADLLVVPRSGSERIFATEDGRFFRTDELRAPKICKAGGDDILGKVAQMDHHDWYSAADSTNLLKKEEVEMEFDSLPGGDLGLVVGCRQTFITTYLFYQSLAWLGKSAGLFAARIESGDEGIRKRADRIWDLLGGIEILVRNKNGSWEKTGEVKEMGPIASDVHLVPLTAPHEGKVSIKLRMTKGLWRIDYLALGHLKGTAEATVIQPSRVTSPAGTDEKARQLLCDRGQYLVTLPGDLYDLYYDLPSSTGEFEVFLRSSGYYIEWMRENWLAEENLSKAAYMFGFPRLFMKSAAPEFKKIEPTMEENFWRSRYVRQN